MTLIDATTAAQHAAPPRAFIESLATGSATGLETLPADALGTTFASTQAAARDWLREWTPQRLPAFDAVRNLAPEGEAKSALKAAPTRGDGAVRVTASLFDPPTREGAPLAYSRNWVSVAVLPTAPEAGRLFYRFGVGSRLVLDGRAETSLVSTSLNFGVVADVGSASPFDAPGFATPLSRPLVGVQAREDAEADAAQSFEGSIAVQAGDAPAMAFVIGLDVLFRDGWVRIHEGSSSWVGAAGAGATGTVEVRFVPESVLRFFGTGA
ncbi:hypothetical protein ACDF64_10545 [Agromyces sp. MMS24-JH15]|uniref:hypothetical protein n=1 Tax=Agromyces sp. MMS24-JH15 TaxID=3243765 RepID=UPI0037480382